jgi:hypothetical protein
VAQYNAQWPIEQVLSGTQFTFDPGIATLGGYNSPVFGSATGGNLVVTTTGDLADASGYPSTDGTAIGTSGFHYAGFDTLWTTTFESATTQNLFYALSDDDFFNKRWLRVTPYDALGAGTSAYTVHSSVSGGLLSYGSAQLFPVELATSPGVAAPVPSGLPSAYVGVWDNASITDATLNASSQ